jgi:DNA-binding transcriptional MocR family regulator
MAEAKYQDQKIIIDGEMLVIKRGQVLTSLRLIAQRTTINKNAISRRLRMLTDDGSITQKTGHHGTTITICNFESYQASDGDEWDTDGTLTGQRRDTDGTHTNKDKNLKEGKEGQEEHTLPSTVPVEAIVLH